MAKRNKRTPANRARSTKNNDVGSLIRHHQQCAKDAFFSFVQQPISSALTWLVIAIALLLPALLYVGLQALSSQTQTLQEGGQITLYLKESVTDARANALGIELQARNEVLSTQYIDKQSAWEDFQNVLGTQTPLLLEDNPLPSSIVVVPTQQNNADLEALIFLLQDLPELEDIQIDLDWLNRLNHLISIIRSFAQLMSIILATAALLIVGNTIRLAIEARKDEVQIIKLLGATDAYVRRPFMYIGFGYGLLGGVAANALLILINILFNQPIVEFLSAYGIEPVRSWLSFSEAMSLLLASIFISLTGARMALWKHLKDTDPT